MRTNTPQSKVIDEGHTRTSMLARMFPTPKFLVPSAAGIDISDTSIKWLVLERDKNGCRVRAHGDQRLQEGIMVHGTITDMDAFVLALTELRKLLGGITHIHAALPEEAAYVFSMHVPSNTSREQILRLIEFEFEGRVPIAPSEAVYDFDIIGARGEDGSQEIGVTVFPHDLPESYTAAFIRAGFILSSLEVEASSIGRAVSTGAADEPVTLIVDFGRARTGFAVLKHGIPIFTSTVEIGGDAITHAVEKELSLSGADVELFKNEQGLLAAAIGKATGIESVIGTASALADEILRHYNYWHTRRNEHGDQVTPVGQVILVGGSSNLRGLADYVAGRVQANVSLGNIWQRMFSFEDYIPPIDNRTALEYATAAGLALRGV
ncbi:MAG TPA: pilus assembly protein PilM [Candidatus Paceibacterota bacterium]|nr:pilus assembly protein PilM [Candidatus Paceibacterota bacterium]